jgi:Restriction endonuclease
MYQKHRDNKRAQGRIYSKKNPDKNRARNQKRRARIANAKTYLVTSQEIKRLYSSQCLFCGRSDRIDLDHAIPLSRGGDHSIGNLIPLCDNCNSTKYNKTIMEWRVYRIRIGNPLPKDKGISL